MSYSLTQVVTDGPLRAPRWAHHLVKILTSAAIALALTAAWLVWQRHEPDPWRVFRISAELGGPVFWLIAAVHEHFWPTDRQPLTTWQHVADWMTDCSLSCVPLVILLIIRDRIGGSLLAGALIAAYLAGHRDARP